MKSIYKDTTLKNVLKQILTPDTVVLVDESADGYEKSIFFENSKYQGSLFVDHQYKAIDGVIHEKPTDNKIYINVRDFSPETVKTIYSLLLRR